MTCIEGESPQKQGHGISEALEVMPKKINEPVATAATVINAETETAEILQSRK